MTMKREYKFLIIDIIIGALQYTFSSSFYAFYKIKLRTEEKMLNYFDFQMRGTGRLFNRVEIKFLEDNSFQST